MQNEEISTLFEEIADMLEIDGNGEASHKFEIRAYRRAALTIGTMQKDVAELYRKGGTDALMGLPGIGKGLADRIAEFITTGKIKKHDQLKKKYPIDFTELTKLQGMGSKRIVQLYKALKVRNVADLQAAVEAHRITNLPRFGKKSEDTIRTSLELYKGSSGRMLLGTVLPEAERLRGILLSSGLAKRVEIAGSLRRMRETIGDIDILIVSHGAGDLQKFVPTMDGVTKVIVSGPTKITVQLSLGITCDMRIVEEESFGSAMQYFTGSKDHGVRVRQIAIRKGYKLSEYGLFSRRGKRVCGDDEEGVYARLGLQYVEPEMRENRGEVELAARGELPTPVSIGEIRGDLHAHTKASDGQNSVEEMAAAAEALGYEYLGISDHSKSEFVAHGMTDSKFREHLKHIDAASKKLDKLCLLKSAEIDILKDGSLDLNKETIRMMDYTLASVHTYLAMPKEEMTERITRAFDTGLVSIWAHPTDRLIGSRAPIAFDFEKVFEAAERNGVIMEINSFPNRLDLNDENILRARAYKLRFSIDTDSHNTQHLQLLRYGVGTARRGWLRKQDVVNTLNCAELLQQIGLQR